MSSDQPPPEDDFLSQLEAAFGAGIAGGGLATGVIGGIWQEGDPLRPPNSMEILEPYFEGDDFSVLSSMNTEQLARFQDVAVSMGLVREVIPGRMDDNTLKAMGSLMALGNRQRVPWQNVLDGIMKSGGLDGSGGAESFDAPTYMAPDYATLAQEVKATFRKRLGRDPDESEMANLVGELQGWDRASYEAQVEGAEANFGAQQQAGSQGGGTVRQVDPLARFQEVFESKYANELDFVEDKQTAQESRAAVQSATQTLSQMSGGS